MCDIFEQEHNTPSKIFNIFKIMYSNPACVTHISEGDRGFESFFSEFGEHADFFIVSYEGDEYVIACSYTYAEVVSVRWVGR